MSPPRIRLLFLVNSLCFGGAEKHVVSLVNGLDIKRYQISLAYLKSDEALLPQIDHSQLEGRLLRCDVQHKIDTRVLHEIAVHLKQEAIDIIVCVNTYSLMYGQLARAKARAPARVVELFHSTVLVGAKERLQMWFYRPFVRCSDMLVYVCASQRQYWRTRLLRARHDTVVHNGIDVDYFTDRFPPGTAARLRRSHGWSANDYVIGLCAAMRPEKAHGDLLQAVARLHQRGLPVKCLLIGDGPERPAIERQIDLMGLRAAVSITGFLDDVRPAIAACDALAIVSHHVETFSLAALEAMAMEKPMVMSAIGGATEQVSQGVTGYLFPRGDIDALAAALRRLSDPRLAHLMGSNARQAVERRFSLPVMLAAYDRLFTGVLESHPSQRANAHVA